MTRKVQEQNHARIGANVITKMLQENQNHYLSFSFTRSNSQGKEGAVSLWACSYFGSARDKFSSTRMRLLGKNNPEGKRTFERRDEPNVTVQISWSLAALEPLWGGRQREHLEKEKCPVLLPVSYKLSR